MRAGASAHGRLLEHRRTYIALRRLALVRRQLIRKPHEDDFRLFRTLPAQHGLFLDVGANTGTSALAFRLFNRRSPILSIEPNPLNAPELRMVRRMLRGFDYRLCAAGDERGLLTLHTPVYNGVPLTPEASLSRDDVLARLPSLREELGIGGRREIEVVETQVPVQPLDDLGLAPDFIKVDVQGWEVSVLRGLQATIRRHRPLVMVEKGANVAEVVELMAAHGYGSHSWDNGGNRLVAPHDPACLNVVFLPSGWTSSSASGPPKQAPRPRS